MYRLTGNLRQNLLPLSFISSIPVLSIVYDLLNNPGRGVHHLVTDMDRNIPFIKIFIIPYVSWYFFIGIALCVLCLKDRPVYITTMLAINSGLLFCYATYFFFQTTVPRPELAGNDMLTRMVAFVYASDPPFNCFPSIHCLISYLIMKGYSNSAGAKLSTNMVIYGLALLIIISTLFVKQHVILDVIAAVLLGDLIFNLIHERRGENTPVRKKKPYALLVAKKKLGI